MAEKRRKLHVQYNQDSSNKLLRYVKYFFFVHLSGNTKYVELIAFFHGKLFFVLYEKGSLISYCVDMNWGHPQRLTADS